MLRHASLLLCGLLAAAGPARALTGRVVDKAGKPLAGVSVALEARKLSGVTDAQGRFSFAVSARDPVTAPLPMRAQGARLLFPPGPVFSAAAISVSGGVAARFRSGGKGPAAWDLSSVPDGDYLLEIRSGGARTVGHLKRMGSRVEAEVTPLLPGGAAKAAAAGDTLGCAKSAFLTKRMLLSGSETDLGDVTLYAVPAGAKAAFVGFDQYSVTVAGKSCQIVVPDKPAVGSPWLWKTYFRAHKPYVDSILLSKGYYHAFIDLPNMYGAPDAVALMDQFYAYMTSEIGVGKKPLLLGISRGGLYAYNWARPNLAKVSAIYADGPVMDFVSWPCGCYGTGSGGKSEWAGLKTVYGFSGDAEAKAYPGNPYQNMKGFAEAHIPLIHVYGIIDTVAPPHENTLRANDSLKAHGWQMVLLAKPKTGHVHGLQAADGALPGQLDTLVAFLTSHTSF
jgi:hypothetical protein